MKKLSSLLLISVFFLQSLYAYHIVGAELTYQYISNDNYKLTLKLYRDCSSAQGALLDDPAYVAIYKSDNTLYNSYAIPLAVSDTITTFTCSPYPANVCLQVGEYYETVNLPPHSGGYIAVYQRCCRNSIVSNIFSPENTGMTAWIAITDSALAHENSSPEFLNHPASVICLNELYQFNYSINVQPDDSLTFDLATPFTGADPFSPQPNPPAPPPYSFVIYVSPYDYLNPLGPSSPVSINSATGLIEMTPNSLGSYLVGVEVSQYRSGILMSMVRSDFEVTVGEFNVGIENQNSTSSIQLINDLNNGILTIENTTGKKLSIKLFDALGSPHLHQSSSENKFQFSTSSLAAGIYFVECADENGMNLLSQKIFVK